MRPARPRLALAPAALAFLGAALLLLPAAGAALPGGPPEAPAPPDAPAVQEATPLPRAPADPNDPRNAPPTSFGSSASRAAARATYVAYQIAGMQQIGEDFDAYRRRIGSITLCEQTRGQVVKNVNGQEVQLDADECVSGSIIAEPGPGGRGGGHFLAMEKGGLLGSMDHDGTRRYSTYRAVPLATPSQSEVAAPAAAGGGRGAAGPRGPGAGAGGGASGPPPSPLTPLHRRSRSAPRRPGGRLGRQELRWRASVRGHPLRERPRRHHADGARRRPAGSRRHRRGPPGAGNPSTGARRCLARRYIRAPDGFASRVPSA